MSHTSQVNDGRDVPVIDAEELYYRLRSFIEGTGAFISDEADALLGDVATAIAEGNDESPYL